MTKTLLGWHFVGDTLLDGRPIPADGEILAHDEPVVICKSGLHASRRIIDALRYAPGKTICRVDCSGIIDVAEDRYVCRRRTILWRVDGENLLRKFACKCALDVAHLWKMPNIVKKYLLTGDENIRYAARNAADRDVARDAARDAARAAAWDAARYAAGAAARDAAGAAARAAARRTQNRRLTSMVIAAHRRQK